MKRLSLLCVIALTICLGLSGMARAKTLVIAFNDELQTLDPADFSHRQTEAMLRQIYEGVSTYTPEREIVYELAESIRAIDDVTYEIKVRQGVTFHDGTPLTAKDVAFSINRLVKEGAMAGRTSQRRGLMGPTQEAILVDDYTVHVKLAHPWPLFERFIPLQMIVPHTVGDDYIEQPIGTGPFVFEEWVRGSHFSVVRNENYWGKKPNIDRVVFRFIKDDSARVAAVRSGEVDIAILLPHHEVPTLDKARNLEVISVPGTRSFFLEMNVNKPPFNDIRVRQAIAYAIDVDTVIDILYGGRATRIPCILSPQAFAYHDGLEPYPYDPQKARQLLAEAGYPNGFEFELDVVDLHRARAEIYQAMLAEVGIKVNIRTWPSSGALKEAWWQAKKLPPEQQRDAVLNDWGNSSLDPYDIIIPKFHSDAFGLGRGNYSGYANAEVDQLLEASLEATTNEERRELFLRVQEIVYQELPMVFEFVPHEIYGVNRRVKDFRPSPDNRIHLLDVDIVE